MGDMGATWGPMGDNRFQRVYQYDTVPFLYTCSACGALARWFDLLLSYSVFSMSHHQLASWSVISPGGVMAPCKAGSTMLRSSVRNVNATCLG